MKLLDAFFGTTPGYLDHELVWRVYDHRTGRKLSNDYGAEIGDLPYDDHIVISKTVKETKSGERYLRVTVRKKEIFPIR